MERGETRFTYKVEFSVSVVFSSLECQEGNREATLKLLISFGETTRAREFLAKEGKNVS